LPKYILTNKALEDLNSIWLYTAETWSEQQADSYYTTLIDRFKEITQKPNLGKNYTGIQQGIFGVKTNRHVIFYRKLNSTTTEITRILHESMDIEERFNKS
jgi:toxin ParE1/3/4